MILPYALFAYSVVAGVLISIYSRRHQRLNLMNVDVLLAIIFQLYWISICLFDYASWYDNFTCSFASFIIVFSYACRYLLFFADRDDRANGVWAGFKQNKGKWRCGRYLRFALLMLMVGTSIYDASL